MFDLCVVGHITRDIIRTNGADKRMPGGTPYYVAMTLKSLGMNVAVVTKLNEKDSYLLDRLNDEKIPVFQQPSPFTTTFFNRYGENKDKRNQQIVDVALPFTIDDLKDVEAKIFHLGPLTKADIPMEVVELLAEKAKITLDVQGFVREVKEGKVKLTEWDEMGAVLPLVDVLKASEEEARVLVGTEGVEAAAVELSRFGPDEVIITRGSKPSLVYSKLRPYWVPAFPPTTLVDPTGAGDTYLAGYLYLRDKGVDVEEAGRFAAMVATLKLEGHGPFVGTEERVRSYAKARGYVLESRH